MTSSLLLSAQHIVPVESPPFSPGVIRVEGDQITDIGGPTLLEKYPHEKIKKLPLALFPGFVNAHCHLDLTALGRISPSPSPPPIQGGGNKILPSPLVGEGQGEGAPANFVDWIREVVRLKNSLDPKEARRGMEKGISDLLKSGVTAVGDHIGFNTDPTPILDSPLKGILFGEVLGLVPEVAQDIYRAFKSRKMDSRPKGAPLGPKAAGNDKHARRNRWQLHISPHSVHAVNPDIFDKVLKENTPPLSCHLAESEPEEAYFNGHRGPLARFIRERGMIPPHHAKTGLAFALERGLDISKLLIIHGNYLSLKELDIIGEKGMSIVHCPGSHAYFGHRPFPMEECLKRGIPVALGTDSIASNTRLDFLDELKRMKKSFPFLTGEQILRMATVNGAKALRMDSEIGSLTPGKKADICGFHVSDKNDLFEIPFKATNADYLMIDGVELKLPA